MRLGLLNRPRREGGLYGIHPIVDAIEYHRRINGMTKKYLAARAGLTVGGLNNYLEGRVKLGPLDNLERLLDILGLEIVIVKRGWWKKQTTKTVYKMLEG